MNRFYSLSALFFVLVHVAFAQAPTDGLVAYYPFYNSAVGARDVVGSYDGYDLVYTTYPEAIVGNGISLHGCNYIGICGSSITLPSILGPNPTNFSISIWVKETGMSHNMGEAYVWFGDRHSDYYGISHFDSNTDSVSFIGGFGKGVFKIYVPQLRNNFHHYVLTFSNGSAKAYLDGSFIKQYNISISNIRNTQGIGKHWEFLGGQISTRFIGVIDELRIYNRALTDAEAQAIYQAEAPQTCPSCLTNQTVSNFSSNDHFCAAQYLCSQAIILANQTQNPITTKIERGDLAKISYLSLLDNSVVTQAEHFPVPFVDLQNVYATNTTYYKYAKVLSYLTYQDGRSPFDRNQLNFNPTDTITRAVVLKVFLESWNIDETTASGSSPFTDVPTSHPYFSYIKKAYDLGLITGSGGLFRPNVACNREDAFLILSRLLTSSVTKPTLAQINAGFFVPGQYRPDNLAVGIGTDRGNFNHYTKTSFALDGVVPLVFAHSYNSYTTELPDQLFPNFIGRGWSHSFNCYVTTIGSGANVRMVVHYPDGKLHFFKPSGNTLVPESIGVFDVVTTAATSVTITTPAKIQYVFEKTAGQTDNYWLIKTIKDRNNNTLTFTNELGTLKNKVRLRSVSDPAGRTLNFVYNATRNWLVEVNLSGVGAFNGRKITFDYHSLVLDGDSLPDLKEYKEPDLTGTLKTTSYGYFSYADSTAHLLKTITLPKGNVVNNTYQQRKLRSSQTLNGAAVVQQMNTNWTSNYLANSQSSVGTVSVTAGAVTKATNYTHNTNGLATNLKSTGTNPMDLSMDYGLGPDQTSVTRITQNAGLPSSTGVRIKYYNAPPYNVEFVKTAKAAGDSITQSYAYNTLSDVTSFTNGRGFTTTFTYNGTGNLTQINHPLGQPTQMQRNTNGTISRVTTPASIVTDFTYNIYGNLLTTSTPNGASPAITTSATYDALSRVLSKTDARNQSVTYEYFANDLLKRMNAPLSYSVGYNYDANDNNTTITNAKGNATTSVYHAQTDQLISRSFGSKTESFTYYEDGSLKTYTNGRGNVFTFTYDPSGRLTDDSYSAYGFNNDGTLNTVTHTQGAKTYVLDYDYDLLKRLSQTTCDGFAVQYRYDNNNNLDRLTYPDSKTVTYGYDAKDRLSTVTDWVGRVTTFVYDNDGKLLNYTLPNGSKAIYSYDAAGRPTGISHQKASNAIICAYTFALDQGGNHTEENIIEPFTTLPALTPGTTNYTVDARNQTTAAGSNSYGFDGNGAITNQAGQTITWDSKDNLLTRNGKTYFYDGNETRRAKTGRRYVINELSNSVIAETDDNGTYLYYYVYGPSGLLYRQNASSGAVEYYHYDFRGSTIAMTDAGQNVVRQYQYDAYGKILQQTPTVATDDNPFRYVGQHGVQYEEASLYFMRARYYDPTTGKFLSEDPIWSTNLYAYGDNNPVMMVDLTGKSPVEAIINTVNAVMTYSHGDSKYYDISAQTFYNDILYKSTISYNNDGSLKKFDIEFDDGTKGYGVVHTSDGNWQGVLGDFTVYYDEHGNIVGMVDLLNYNMRLKEGFSERNGVILVAWLFNNT